jgi:hypothetical protein
MSSKDEMRSTLNRLTQRNVEISELLDKIRSKKLTEESSARDKALQEEFDANQGIISELMMGLFRSEDISD